jgi:5'(3')-deoxyribonucleotidase
MSKLAYIDLDGVLARWQLHEVSRQCGRTITEADWCPILGWDIVSVIAKLGGPAYETPAAFWATVTEESWATAPRTEHFDKILEGCVDLVGRENVRICTAPPPDHNPSAYSGKAIWMKRELPEWLHRNVVLTERKYELASPDRLLIDDADHNREEWMGAGGPLILIPRPWNEHHGVDVDDYLRFSFRYMHRFWAREAA